MMLDKVQLKNLKKELKEEIKKELEEDKVFKILGREELQKIFNCNKTKMNEIMHSVNKPPVVYIGRDYYITEKQMQEYFKSSIKKCIDKEEEKEKQRRKFKILHKKDLMEMFKMGRTTFLKFINTGTLPVKTIGQEYYIEEECLEEWFYKVQGTTIKLKTDFHK